ncbi:NAD(P)-binding protein [Corynebacterium sp. CCM 9185]|uniref:NAD(P)-binding protein n=1 Tax=Corynebacterium marambiense TaxID=2765364 RepID=A0ABS0VSQ4_9CORY|nr:FAD-dependent oxidoreductase [Corynebacterium marambiense]MBI8999806.1 NAD(P)-binding protein [Corynebacterium marambiense]MCK7662645.1 NAD(P)-binding protein [Corynebacterium marambiense]MCX7543656.1 NAD(P)-binding protein [Corynebacterium marambiense]
MAQRPPGRELDDRRGSRRDTRPTSHGHSALKTRATNTTGYTADGRHKVIVIGAGFAGLSAARELEPAGIEVVIHEARGRIGVRT